MQAKETKLQDIIEGQDSMLFLLPRTRSKTKPSYHALQFQTSKMSDVYISSSDTTYA